MTKIALDEYREVACDVAAWREKAQSLRTAADLLWDSFAGFFSPEMRTNETKQAIAIRQASERISTSTLLYGLATETSLKARIIQADPKSIVFAETTAEDGSILDMSIKKIGVNLGADGHDLVKLAEVAQVLNPSDSILFPVASDFEATKEILTYLTDCVRWSGRYPAPKRFSERYIKPSSMPSRAFGLYMRDWLDPFLDSLFPTSVGPTSSTMI